MTDTEKLDNLKLDADALGINYRSDIKATTLQAKIDDCNKEKNPASDVKDPAVTEYSDYKNTTTNNMFTEGGRCAPQSIVNLTPDEAKKYKGLELCEK